MILRQKSDSVPLMAVVTSPEAIINFIRFIPHLSGYNVAANQCDSNLEHSFASYLL